MWRKTRGRQGLTTTVCEENNFVQEAIYRDVFPQQSLPPRLSFVLRGAWQIGKGLQAVYRKLWNTMNGAGTDPHPPKKIACSNVEGPWRETDGAQSPALILL